LNQVNEYFHKKFSVILSTDYAACLYKPYVSMLSRSDAHELYKACLAVSSIFVALNIQQKAMAINWLQKTH
jgi:hypothetical protein